jgi:hypothetical protein
MKTKMSASPYANLQFEIQRRMVEVYNPVQTLPLEKSILFSPTCGERIATGKVTAEVLPRTGHGDPEVE